MHAVFGLVESSIEQSYQQMSGREADIAHLIRQHRGIFDAIEAYDPQAGMKALDAHLTFIRGNVN
ncbi:FCD domain-containing protein [Crenobacter cavernae]|uniref:FCD domain-containing protein n=1 Tax=Crenobacter cavernae TaxID=2290923 RepID=A0ABY0FE61_9NEIS|nr:FCD domain-containing protein [Crenobacter cavernae]